MFIITTAVFDEPSPPFISQTLRDGTPQVQIDMLNLKKNNGIPLGTVRPLYRTGVPLPSRHPILYTF